MERGIKMINNVTLMGRLTAAPELKQTGSGISVTAFCIAIDRRFQKDGEKQADFINCVAWRNTAEFIARYFGKGDMIAVTGAIQTRKYQDNSGNNRVAVEVVIDNASFCGGKNSASTEDSAPQFNPYTNAGGGFEEIKTDDDLPF
jgi:single-strand DNA-binding protein